MEIRIKSISHHKQREPFWVGDYFIRDGVMEIRASDTGNENYNFYIGLHETIEQWSTKLRGIKESDIHAFDTMFEKEREQGLHGEDDEPGDDPRAPYYRDHQFASAIEHLTVVEFGDSPHEYFKAIKKLFEKEIKPCQD